VAVRILHVSDLHLGRRETPEPYAALRDLAPALAPDVVVATGDLSHRGKRAELERAAELLAGLGAPLVAVPGNHDLPYTVPARFSRPFAEWEHAFGATTPVHVSDGLVLAGLNSVQPWRQQGGALRGPELAGALRALADAPEGALRVVALHHHLAAPPWRAGRKRPLHHRDAVLRDFARAGVELVLGGHVHQAVVTERREFEVLDSVKRRSLVLVTVPGLGRPRPRRRGEAVGFNLYEADATTLTVVTHAWAQSGFQEVGRRFFFRG
jgi:3',5'-cyclic AMP phosphodiesterase CpdA